MKKKTPKLVIAFVLTALAAYTAGAYFQFPTTSGKAAGEVRRAKVYTSNVVEIDANNMQERLQSDSVFCAQLTNRATLMQKQANTLAELIQKSNEVVGENDSLKASLNALNIPYQSVLNSCKALDTYVESLSVLSNGGKVNDFEQIYNNALLGYYLVNSKSGIVGSFRDNVQHCLSESEPNDELASLYDNWNDYSDFCNLLNGDASSVIKQFSQDQLDAYYRYAEESKNQLYRDQEQMNYFVVYNEQMKYFVVYNNQLNYFVVDREQLNAIPLYNELQYKAYDQQQLNSGRAYNQDQQMKALDQEQLNYFVVYNDQLNRASNQDQLNYFVVYDEQQMNCNNQEQLNYFVVYNE